MKKKNNPQIKTCLEFLFSVAAGLELFRRIDDTNFSNMFVFLFCIRSILSVLANRSDTYLERRTK
jgi:hypothetical protein